MIPAAIAPTGAALRSALAVRNGADSDAVPSGDGPGVVGPGIFELEIVGLVVVHGGTAQLAARSCSTP